MQTTFGRIVSVRKAFTDAGIEASDFPSKLKANARTALEVQDACNPSGVANLLAEALRDITEAGGDMKAKCESPVLFLLASKLLHLAGGECICDGCMRKYQQSVACAVEEASDGVRV